LERRGRRECARGLGPETARAFGELLNDAAAISSPIPSLSRRRYIAGAWFGCLEMLTAKRP